LANALNQAQTQRDPAAPRPATAPSSPTGKHKRHLKNYLLDKGLQLRYVVFVTVLSAVLCGTFGFLIWKQKDAASDTIIDGINRVDWIDAGMKADISKTLRAGDFGIVKRMAGFAAVLIVVLSMFLIVMTHRVAGPLYKIGMYFERMRDGRLSEITDLRKGDQFQDFFEHFKYAHQALRGRAREEIAVYERFIRACEAQPDLTVELRQKLDELATAKREKERSLVG
jgi:hypothetical protein